ncbi:MAG TPA: Rrf2 family transcriptional regulator [Candidatus Dorea intestinavium]|nr:Rrf2 family transcriptional regulator [Candidatus Dorea intestinavium]
MKLSTKGRYGLRAIIDMARFSKEEPVSISSIAARQDISERYLEQIVALLKKAGLVKSIRGATGGYILARDPKLISVGDVLRALEGSLEAVECSAAHGKDGCSASGECVTKFVWQKINDSINNTVDDIKLVELVDESIAKNPLGEVEKTDCKN